MPKLALILSVFQGINAHLCHARWSRRRGAQPVTSEAILCHNINKEVPETSWINGVLTLLLGKCLYCLYEWSSLNLVTHPLISISSSARPWQPGGVRKARNLACLRACIALGVIVLHWLWKVSVCAVVLFVMRFVFLQLTKCTSTGISGCWDAQWGTGYPFNLPSIKWVRRKGNQSAACSYFACCAPQTVYCR